MTTKIDVEKACWQVLSVRHCRELKLKAELEQRDVRCFVPMRYVERQQQGRIERKWVSALPCLLFVFATRSQVDALLEEYRYTFPFRYLRNRATREPIVISEKEMMNFMAVAGNEALSEQVHYLGDEAQQLKRGEEVMVRAGAFKGITGRIVRVKRQRRILVELQGVAHVVTAYIPNQLLERVDAPPSS
jgi:transcription antitermination factor NusG